MNVIKCKLGDILDLKYGKGLPERSRVSGPYRVYGSGGVVGTHESALVPGPGVIVGRKGSIGTVYYEREAFFPIDTVYYALPRREGMTHRFLYCLLRTCQLQELNTDAAVPGLNRTNALSVDVSFPEDSSTRTRICDSLSWFDDLIENNTRRITLLGDTARLLYEEWFVRLRFPGHEHTLIRDGIPEGWDRKTLEEVGPLHYGKALKKDDRTDGEYPVYGSSGVVGSHETALVKGPGIVVGRKGNVGSVHLSLRDFWPIDTVYYVAPDRFSYFLLHNLQYQNFINGDAAVPGLNRTFAHSLPVLVPNKLLADEFERQATVLYAQIVKLQEMNIKLTAARDLLLPRLMSGEVAV